MIDTHSHIYLDNYSEDRNTLLKEAQNEGLDKLLLPNIDTSTIEDMHEVVKLYPKLCYPMMGLHPGSVRENYKDELSEIERYLFAGEYCAVGEIGMDLYWPENQEFLKEQKEVLETQMYWAQKLNLPVVIHVRNSFKETLDIVQKFKYDLTGVFHCFSGSEADAKQVMDMGFVLGIGGVLTYKKSDLPEIVQYAGIDKLVLETDAPFLPPVPHRGKRNIPVYIFLVAQKLSEIMSLDINKVIESTDINAERIFFTNER